jgi:hypothetical protein
MRTLDSFRDIHRGETIVVCGCGESLNELAHPERFITIGVNDVGRCFQPNYLVVVNPRSQFSGDRFHYVENSRAEYLFTQLDLGVPHPNVVKFRLGAYGGTDFSNPDVLHYTQNSPYVALCLAVHMGARHIGLIGVDFTDNHFFAKTGTHALSRQLPTIDGQYRHLGDALRARGVEVFNLSRTSRLTAFPNISVDEFTALANACEQPSKGTVRPLTSEAPVKAFSPIPNATAPVEGGSIVLKPGNRRERVFFVNYKFLSCGDVFRHGLRHAAEDLAVEYAEAYWDDTALPYKVQQFSPDLLFVVHGRMFARRRGASFKEYNSAVWLVDEPYEVDDTSKFSNLFTTVYVNDPNTITQHRNAHYLPTCCDPHVHFGRCAPRKYDVGFIGGYSPTRERLLEELCREHLLSYVVGGPWKGSELNKICLANNIPAHETAEFYRQTKIVINIFREVHHFNRQKIPPSSLNPRVYEAFACGALVVSEDRTEARQVFPTMPVFNRSSELVGIVRQLISDGAMYEGIRMKCMEGMRGQTFADRLRTILSISLREEVQGIYTAATQGEKERINRHHGTQPFPATAEVYEDWEPYGDVAAISQDGSVTLRKVPDNGPGTEMGLVSKKSFADLDLSFEVNIKDGACFIAKIHQEDRIDQKTNSYHLMCAPTSTYFAKHNHIFERLSLRRDSWESIRIQYRNGVISLYRGEACVLRVKNQELQSGYSFLGLKGGEVRLRNIHVKPLQTEYAQTDINHIPEYEVYHSLPLSINPIVSIITTVYDRPECLKECIKSVKNLTYKNYEHIIVSDSPRGNIVESIKSMVVDEDNGKIGYVNLKKRFNDWGVTPASVGLQLSRGEYVCFLSDDNGYTPDHITNLVTALEGNAQLGFVYSSCQYDGRKVLNSPIPKPAQLDLGQLMFRKAIFDQYTGNTLPFKELAWDWRLVDFFMRHGVEWRHVDKQTFLFKLAKYPQFIARR